MEEEFKLFTEERKKLVVMNKQLKDELDCYKVCLLKLTPFVSSPKEGSSVEVSETSHQINEKLEDYNFKMFFVSLLNNNEMGAQKSSPSISSDQLCRVLINSNLLVNPTTDDLKFSESEKVPESLQSKIVENATGNFTDYNNQSVSTSFILDENKSEDSKLLCETSQNGTGHQISPDDQICSVLCQSPEEQNSFKIKAPTDAIEGSVSINERYQNTTKIKDSELIEAHPSNDLHIDNSDPTSEIILETNTDCKKELFFSDQTISTVQNSEYSLIGKNDDSPYNNLSIPPSSSLAEAASPSSLNEDTTSVLQSLDADEPADNDLLNNETTKKLSDVIKKTTLKANLLRKNRAGYGRPSSKVMNTIIEVPKIIKRPLTSKELEDYEKGNMTIRLLDLAEAYEAYKKDQEDGKNCSLRLGEYITIPDNVNVNEATVTENDMLFSDSNGSAKVENPPEAKVIVLKMLFCCSFKNFQL